MAEHVQAKARELASVFASRAAHWDRTRTYCWENVHDLTEAGIMGMSIPTAYGGAGASFHDVVLVVEEIARACTLSARVVVEANMGGISAIMAYGTEEQKRSALRWCSVVTSPPSASPSRRPEAPRPR